MFERRLVCPYCGDVKSVKKIWQGRPRFCIGDVFWLWPFVWDYNFRAKNYEKCRCDLGLVMPPHLHQGEVTSAKDCPICLEWAVKDIKKC
jgi:hypothetical protein